MYQEAHLPKARQFQDLVGGSASDLLQTFPSWHEIPRELIYKEALERIANSGPTPAQTTEDPQPVGGVDNPMPPGIDHATTEEEKIRQARAKANSPDQLATTMAQLHPLIPNPDLLSMILLRIRFPPLQSPRLANLVMELQRVLCTRIKSGMVEFHPNSLIAFFPCSVTQARAVSEDLDFQNTFPTFPWKDDPIPNHLFGLTLECPTPISLTEVRLWWVGLTQTYHRYSDVQAHGDNDLTNRFFISNATYRVCCHALQNPPLICGQTMTACIGRTPLNRELIPGMGFSFSLPDRNAFWQGTQVISLLQ